MFDTQVTVVGNLVAEPRLGYTKDGQPFASFRLASTPRRFDRASGAWKDGDTLFASVTCWRALAENVYQSLKKGNSVIVIGKLSVRPYEKDGEKRQSVEIDAMAVGPELGRVTTIVKRAERPVQPSAGSENAAPSDDDHVPSQGFDGDDSPEADLAAPGSIDWGVSLGEPFGDSLRELVDGDVSQVDEGATGLVINPTAAAMDSAEPALPTEPVESVAQLASTGGRWRSRSAS